MRQFVSRCHLLTFDREHVTFDLSESPQKELMYWSVKRALSCYLPLNASMIYAHKFVSILCMYALYWQKHTVLNIISEDYHSERLYLQ